MVNLGAAVQKTASNGLMLLFVVLCMQRSVSPLEGRANPLNQITAAWPQTRLVLLRRDTV